MIKYFFVSAAALVMMTGLASAQTTSSETTTSTVSPAAEGSFRTTKSQMSIDGYGTQTDKSQTYTSGATGTNASSTTRVTAPDGSQSSTQRDEKSVSPSGDTTIMHSTTTSTKP